MIAKLSEPFPDFSEIGRKIDYQFNKVKKGDAELIWNNAVGEDYKEMKMNFQFAKEINDRVKNTYLEITLNLNKNEEIENQTFLDIANEYLEKMGYSDSMHAIFLNVDKEHLHLHILLTTIDLQGKWIDDSYSYQRSMKITQGLEEKYGLIKTNCIQRTPRLTFGESKLREYSLHNALCKAVKDYSLKSEISRLLPGVDLSIHKTNDAYKAILGDELYEKVFAVLDKKGMFNKLYKDELLNKLDIIHAKSDSLSDFKEQVKENGIYMRLISDKGKTYYIYGLTDIGFYCKDMSFPKKYRYGFLFQGRQKIGAQKTPEEQKKYLYEAAFLSLTDSVSYDEFKLKLKEKLVSIIESKNSRGIVGISFSMDIDNATIFKGSDISKRLSFGNIMKCFHGQESEIDRVTNNPDIINDMRNRYVSDYHVLGNLDHFASSKKYDQEEYKDLSLKKKKKKRRLE